MKIEQLEEKIRRFGPVGALFAALGCATCFPLLGTLAAAVGLGFLSGYERFLITWVLPTLVIFLFTVAVVMSRRDDDPVRKVLRIMGPSGMLFAIFLIWDTPLRGLLFYTGLLMTIGVGVWDWRKSCGCGDEE